MAVSSMALTLLRRSPWPAMVSPHDSASSSDTSSMAAVNSPALLPKWWYSTGVLTSARRVISAMVAPW